MNLENIPPDTYRILFAIVFFVNMFIVGRYRHKAQAGERFDLSLESPWVRYGLRVPALAGLVYMVVYVAAPGAVGWSLVHLPSALRLAAAGIALTIVPTLVVWAQTNLGDNVSTTIITRESHELITTGPYRWVRHPLYVIGTLLYTCLIVISGSWVLAAALLVGLIFVLKRTPQEEAMLEERFGEAYRDYRRRTGRFVPRIRTGG